MKNHENLFFLFQVAGFDFSMERPGNSCCVDSVVKHGLADDPEKLYKYLLTFSRQVISFDFPFICSAYAYDPSSSLVIKELKFILNAYWAMLLNPPVGKAGCTLGKNWLQLCIKISDNTSLKKLDTLFKKNKLDYHFPIVFGLSMKALHFSSHQTLCLFFYMTLRDQITAFIRTGVTSRVQAYTALYKVLNFFSPKISTFESTTYEDAHKSSYLLELLQLTPETFYNSFFQQHYE